MNLEKKLALCIIFLLPICLNAQFNVSASITYNKWINEPDYSFGRSLLTEDEFINIGGIGFTLKGIYSINSYFGLGFKSGYLPWEHMLIKLRKFSPQGDDLGIVDHVSRRFFIPSLIILNFIIYNNNVFKIVLNPSIGVYNEIVLAYENDQKVYQGYETLYGGAEMEIGCSYLFTENIYLQMNISLMIINNFYYRSYSQYDGFNYFFLPSIGVGVKL